MWQLHDHSSYNQTDAFVISDGSAIIARVATREVANKLIAMEQLGETSLNLADIASNLVDMVENLQKKPLPPIIMKFINEYKTLLIEKGFAP